MGWKIRPAAAGLKGDMRVPPDKSISHRAVMYGSIAEGTSRVKDFLLGEDCMRTLEAFVSMGVDISREDSSLSIRGKGLRGLKRPSGPLQLGNSGTTMRILPGILVSQDFDVELVGDESLSRRPMNRIIEPLSLMGADIRACEGGYPPLRIFPSADGIRSLNYNTPVASAQVKSCVLSAALYADGVTTVKEPFQSRDHTERMLEAFSAAIKRKGLVTSVEGGHILKARDITVPGDISSAAFFIVAALIVGSSEIVLRNVGLNPTRTGIIDVLRRMGASIEVVDIHEAPEPYGDLRIKSSELSGTEVGEEEVPSLIDEIPVLSVAALMAEGETRIEGISELKVKETDRIRGLKENFLKMGAELREDGGALVITGRKGRLKPGVFESYGDHRMAMTMAVAALVAGGESTVNGTECVNTSYPGFISDISRIAP